MLPVGWFGRAQLHSQQSRRRHSTMIWSELKTVPLSRYESRLENLGFWLDLIGPGGLVLRPVRQANTSFWWIKLQYLASIDDGSTVSSYTLATCMDPAIHSSIQSAGRYPSLYIIHCQCGSFLRSISIRSLFYPLCNGFSFPSTSIIHCLFFASARVVGFFYSTWYK